MRALVTGATGFVGSHVAELLLARGDEVRVLVRPTSSLANLRCLDVQPVEGDLRDAPSLERAVAGCEVVFHVAADYRLWSRDPADLYRTNVEGTRNVLQACRRASVVRVVYTSTVGALGIPADGSPGTETTPVTLADMVGHYKRSKFLAEEEARRAWAEEHCPVVIVNPSTPVGDRDARPTPTGKIVVDFLNGRMPAFVQTGLNLIDVRDVARGHLLAAERGKPGERYILGNLNATLEGILARLASIVGVRPPSRQIPLWVASAAAWMDTFVCGTLLRREPHIPLEGVRMARKHMYFDSSRAVRELGLPQSSVDGALARAVAWFQANGYVGKR